MDEREKELVRKALSALCGKKKEEMKLPISGERFWGAINPITLIDSNLNLKSGDRTVVGVSRLNISSSPDVNNKGFILIISGKIAS